MSSITADTATSSALVTRIRDQWAVVQAQWVNLPETLRRTWDQVSERIRTALDLPTKDDLAALSSRLDQLDARLAEFAAARGIAVETTPDNGIPTRSKIVADKRSRKAKS